MSPSQQAKLILFSILTKRNESYCKVFTQNVVPDTTLPIYLGLISALKYAGLRILVAVYRTITIGQFSAYFTFHLPDNY